MVFISWVDRFEVESWVWLFQSVVHAEAESNDAWDGRTLTQSLNRCQLERWNCAKVPIPPPHSSTPLRVKYPSSGP